VVRAVATARRANLPLQLNTTGHAMGRTDPPNDSLLLRPLIDAPVRVDPATRTARVPAGRIWSEVLPEAVKHGLTALHGTSPTVGVIGYLLSGGLSFYGHMHGVVTGMAMWNAADAAQLAPVWQAWARTAPPEITTSLRMLSLPPLPDNPPFLAGKRVLALDGAVAAMTEADLPAARRILDEMLSPLTTLAEPVSNTWAPASPQALPLTHMDAPQPVPFRSGSALIHELDEAGWAKVLDAAPGLLALELRQLGGAFANPPADGGALDRFPAPLLYYAVGVAGNDTDRDLTAIRSAFEPYVTGRTAPNFINHSEEPQRSYEDEVRTRVERVRRGVDRRACSPATSHQPVIGPETVSRLFRRGPR
jgi:hypothetical protein